MAKKKKGRRVFQYLKADLTSLKEISCALRYSSIQFMWYLHNHIRKSVGELIDRRGKIVKSSER